MSRAVTADHVLFDECISAFRPNEVKDSAPNFGPNHSYLLTSFQLPIAWNLPHCTVNPSITIDLPGPYRSFICKVNNPERVGTHNSQLYGIALASIISFISGKVIKSTRDDLMWQHEPQGDEIIQLAIHHPILYAGPGSSTTQLTKKTLSKYEEETIALITKLHQIPYTKYVIVMQAIRLVHLSLSNKREDFGLAHLLIVSAIESAAQQAIKITSNKNPEEEEKEKEWKKIVDDKRILSDLLQEYRALRSNANKAGNIKKQYIDFIKKFAPPSTWEGLVPHPWQDHYDTYIECSPDDEELPKILEKKHGEIYPSDLTIDEISTLLSDSYIYRSCFVHRGKQPPHRSPTPFNHYFETLHEYFTGKPDKLLPSYDLLVSIAQNSIKNWMHTIPNEK